MRILWEIFQYCIQKNKGCTRQRAVALNCNVSGLTSNNRLPSTAFTRHCKIPRPVRTISEWAVKNEDSFVCRSTEKIANDGDRQLNERNVVVCQK